MSGADITAFMPRALVDMLEDACDAIRGPGAHGAVMEFGPPEMKVFALGTAVGEWARSLAGVPGREELVSTVNHYIRDQLNAAEQGR